MRGGICAVEAEGLGVFRVLDKLARGGVEVLSARPTQKNTLEITIRGKDVRKTFAILRGSCYNIKKVRPSGLSRLLTRALPRVGLIVGALLFALFVCFFETRILAVRVEGSGAYYEREIRAILEEEGVGRFSARPRDTAMIVARILALPRVEFCTVETEGGVLRVKVEADRAEVPASPVPLCAPASGVVEELIVVRGTPCVRVGDSIAQGEVAVACYSLLGGRQVPVCVMAKIAVRYHVEQEYELGEREAAAQALIDFGSLENMQMRRTERGFLVEGDCIAVAAAGLA